MKLLVEWRKPFRLKRSRRDYPTYGLDLERLPGEPGVYVFGRRWGSQFEALYVGRANMIRQRVRSQMNNHRLMQHLKAAKAGKRILLAGCLTTKPGQQIDQCLPLVERALIRYFLSEGHDLVNKQGTRLRRHELVFTGKHPKRFLPALMFVEKN